MQRNGLTHSKFIKSPFLHSSFMHTMVCGTELNRIQRREKKRKTYNLNWILFSISHGLACIIQYWVRQTLTLARTQVRPRFNTFGHRFYFFKKLSPKIWHYAVRVQFATRRKASGHSVCICSGRSTVMIMTMNIVTRKLHSVLTWFRFWVLAPFVRLRS